MEENIPVQHSDDDVNDFFDRNPSPPPELEHNEDATADIIADTLVSKTWVLETLMQALKEVKTDDANNCEEENAKDKKSSFADLDKNVEDEICKLWDMSMDAAVAEYLMTMNVHEILLSIITKSNAPRLTEICLGIVGNLACNFEYCDRISDSDDLITTVISLLDYPDPQTLVQVIRILNIGVITPSTSKIWTCALKAELDAVQKRLSFILESSTNVDLLKSMAEFVDNVLETDEELCRGWSRRALVGGIVEAMNELNFRNVETVETFWHVLQVISTQSEEVIHHHWKTLFDLGVRYINLIFEDDFVIVSGHQCGLASVIAVLMTLCTEGRGNVTLAEERKLLRQLLRLLSIVARDEKSSITNDILKEVTISFWCHMIQDLSLPNFVLDELENAPSSELKVLVDEIRNASSENFDYLSYLRDKSASSGCNKLSEMLNI